VGSPGFSGDTVTFTSLAIGQSNEPYVAYMDWGNSYQVTVKMYNGTDWVNVGDPGFTDGYSPFINLKFSPDNHLYEACHEGMFGKATVRKFDGNNWICVGDSGFSLGSAAWISFAFSPDGTPYVGYSDYLLLWKATVMKYDFPVGSNEQKESSLLLCPNPVNTNLTIDLTKMDNILKSVEIYDLSGNNILETKTNKDKIILNVGNYPKGIYIVRLKTEKSISISKFCKN
jgi:hypothetical protein